MDHTHRMSSRIPEEAPGEVLPFYHDILSRRPYQAYCVTEASSRPPSPDSLVPKPLRSSATPVLQAAIDTHSANIPGFDQNNSSIQAAASSPEQYVESATLRKTGHYSKRQTSPSNRRLSPERTRSGNTSNHITRAVTPRGSHSLAPFEVTAYDRPPSHSRMQHSTSFNNKYNQTDPCKTIERHSHHADTHPRPLPPLPLGVASATVEPQGIDVRGGEIYGLPDEQAHSEPLLVPEEPNNSDNKASPPYKKNHYLIPRRPLPDLPVDIRPDQPSQGAASEDKVSSPILNKLSDEAVLVESRSSARELRLLDSGIQEPTAVELYIPRGHWDNIDDDIRAPRRTETRTTDLKYRFGQLLSRPSNLPPSTSPHRDSYLQPVFHTSNPAPSFRSSTDIQNGPRPPPWGSYEDLEIQRRQRGDARGRLQVGAKRLTADSSSMYQKSMSTDSLVKDPAREVDEYREQILGVYPDMEFNGEAGKDDRGLCCCVLM